LVDGFLPELLWRSQVAARFYGFVSWAQPNGSVRVDSHVLSAHAPVNTLIRRDLQVRVHGCQRPKNAEQQSKLVLDWEGCSWSQH
jgi:hypothetical protein